MNSTDKHIQNIIQANRDNSLTIFVGAGISMSSDNENSKMPSWADLINDLKADLGIEDESDYLKIAQLYYLEFGEFVYYKKLSGFFSGYVKPSELHTLIFKINPHFIITTNWDTILEKAIEENGFIYDVVRSDLELTKSSLQNKVIKMHGDFASHKIVFKEDDYINYGLDFPLMENFIKSILSTHTVLFIGYSYNDFNLKQILNWIQKHSKVRPPMYLASSGVNPSRVRYLENHGITILDISKEDSGPGIFLHDQSAKVYSLLKRIRNSDEAKVGLSKDLTYKFILKRLKGLDSLNGILLSQIQKSLTNCEFVYDENNAILKFHQGELTTDYDESKRSVYRSFVGFLREREVEKQEPVLEEIFSILKKADIKGIVTSDNRDTPVRFLEFEKEAIVDQGDSVDDHLSFCYLDKKGSSPEINAQFEFAFRQQEIGRIEESFAVLEDLVGHCLKRKLYPLLFIAMYNRNNLLYRLKYWHIRGVDYEKYRVIEEYDLKETFFNLPKDLRIAIEPLFKFVDRSWLVNFAFTINQDLKKKQAARKTVDSGGMVFNSEPTRHEVQHGNLVRFVLRNSIFIEKDPAFQSINLEFLKISILRRFGGKKVTFNRIEIFSCIRYIDHKDLRLLLEQFYQNSSKEIGQFQINPKDRTWLINSVFRNLADIFIQHGDSIRNYEEYIQNTLLLLSITKHSKKQFESIVEIISDFLIEANNTYSIFSSINLFLGIQYRLYKTEMNSEKLTNMIEGLIQRLIYKKYNGHEYRAITSNEVSNLYGYARIGNLKLTNIALVGRLVDELRGYSISEQIDVSQNLLMNIYQISDEAIKRCIVDYVTGVDTSKEPEPYRRITFGLTLMINEIVQGPGEIGIVLSHYISELKKSRTFSSALYTIQDQIQYLSEQKGIKDFDAQLIEINEMVELHEKRENSSIF